MCEYKTTSVETMGKELEFINGACVLGALPLSVQVVEVKCSWLDFSIERITAWGTGSNSGRGTKVPQASQCGQKNEKELRGLKRPFKTPCKASGAWPSPVSISSTLLRKSSGVVGML